MGTPQGRRPFISPIMFISPELSLLLCCLIGTLWCITLLVTFSLFSGIHDVWKTLCRTRNIVYFFHQVYCFTVNLILPSIDFRNVISYCYQVERWTRNFKRLPVRKLWIIIRLVSHAAVLRGALRDDLKNGCIRHHYSTKSIIVIRRPKLRSSLFLLATKWLRYPIKRAKITTCFLRPCL